jgi:lysophospholipase L1-like esterase
MNKLFCSPQSCLRLHHQAVILLLLAFVVPVTAQEQTPAPTFDPRLPTVFLVGDSTARNNANGAQGWGEHLARHFDTKRINVAVRARAGLSSRTLVSGGQWDNVLKEMKPGDFVLIQLGHNDLAAVEGPRARGSLPGTGEETKDVTLPTDSTEVVHTYGSYLRKLIADTRERGATPIILSLTVRNIWKDGKVERGAGRIGAWAVEVAAAQGVAFVDVTRLIADHYEQIGQESAKKLFGPDYVHTNPAGAEVNAGLIIAGLRQLRGLPLVGYLNP